MVVVDLVVVEIVVVVALEVVAVSGVVEEMVALVPLCSVEAGTEGLDLLVHH